MASRDKIKKKGVAGPGPTKATVKKGQGEKEKREKENKTLVGLLYMKQQGGAVGRRGKAKPRIRTIRKMAKSASAAIGANKEIGRTDSY